MYKVFITTSGTGSRLRSYTQNTNKVLLPLGNSKVIDHIINSYDSSMEFVFSLGYFGNKIKKYISENYKNLKITYVSVDPFKGEGSSLGYSMLCAEKYLRCPFIFHCNDTIVKEKIPSPENENWDGISFGDDLKVFNTGSYSSVVTNNGYVVKMQKKGASECNGLHIGLVGIFEFELFWKSLSDNYKKDPKDQTLNDCVAIADMLKANSKFKAITFKDWFDTGNLDSFRNAKKRNL